MAYGLWSMGYGQGHWQLLTYQHGNSSTLLLSTIPTIMMPTIQINRAWVPLAHYPRAGQEEATTRPAAGARGFIENQDTKRVETALFLSFVKPVVYSRIR